MHADLDVAKKRLNRKNLSLVIAKSGKVLFETKSHGINDLLKAINHLKDNMKGSSVADRVVGRAAALLLAYSGTVAVIGVTISDGGIEVLKNNRILYEFETRVPSILNLEKTEVCPFEKLVAEFSNPKEAYEKLMAHCA